MNPEPTHQHDPLAEIPTILVVDDDQDLREVISSILSLYDYNVVTAGNGKEALDLLRGGLRPRLILLDLMMPIMDGWEFRDAQLKDQALRGLPVLIVTAAHQHMDRGGRLEPAAFLKKPMELDDLLAAVQRHCA